jgi:hypothetical protein
VLVAAALATAGACAAGTPAPTRLLIAVHPEGPTGPTRHYTLTCNPSGGTVPRPARACRVLAGLAHPFAPTPPGTTCTEISLGPQTATVAGRLRGRRVFAHLSVSGGCQIERWRRVAAVVPGFSSTS